MLCVAPAVPPSVKTLSPLTASTSLPFPQPPTPHQSINKAQSSWTAGVNEKFVNATLKDVQRLLGTRVGTPEQKKKFAALENRRVVSDALPASFNATGKYGVADPGPRSLAPSNFKSTNPGRVPFSRNPSANWPKCAGVIGNVRDQSDCGCCWAFGSTESFNDRMCIVHGYMSLLSPQDTCSCCNGNHGCSSGGCDGGFTEGECSSRD